MQDRRELIQAIVEAIGPLINAKNETLKTTLLAEIKVVKTELKDDIARLEKKLDGKLVDHETRISQLEADREFPHKN